MVLGCKPFWLGAICVLLLSVTARAAEMHDAAGWVTRLANGNTIRIPLRVWQSDRGHEQLLHVSDHATTLRQEASISAVAFRFQLARTSIPVFYRMVGLQQGWQLLPAGMTHLNYPQLPAGHYRLEIKVQEPQGQMSAVFPVATIWEVSPWGRTSQSIGLLALLCALGVWLWRSGLLLRIIKGEHPQHRSTPSGTVQTIRPGFLVRLTSECRTALMLMQDNTRGTGESTLHVQRGLERLQGVLLQLDQYIAHPHSDGRMPFILRSWLLPRLEWHRAQTESLGVTWQTLLVPDAAVTLDSQLLDDWLLVLVLKAQQALGAQGQISLMIMLDTCRQALVTRIMFRGDTAPSFPVDEALNSPELELLWHRLALAHGDCLVCQSDEMAVGWELQLPCTWSLLPGLSGDTQPLTVSVAPAEGPRLLVVESDPDMQALLLAWLGSDYRLQFSAALRGAWEHVHGDTIDLVLCTALWLPDGEPGELLCRLKRHEETQHIPFILCGASEPQKVESNAWDGYADDYLVLPLNPQRLRSRLQALLENRQRLLQWLDAQRSDPEEDGPLPDGRAVLRLDGQNQPFGEILYARTRQLLAQEAMSVDKLAEQMGLSSRTLQRKLQALFGVSYSDYVRKVQMQLVLGQLQRGASVKEAARVAGFRDQAYLTRVFRQSFAMSPTEYRKRRMTENDLA